MTQHIKPANIQGLNTGHTLHSDIQAFLEFGQLDKELVGDTALTTTAALVDDVDIGDARTFDATADAVAETVTISGDITILVVARLTGARALGDASTISFISNSSSGNNVTLQFEGFTPYKYRSIQRANFSSTIVTNGDGFASDDVFDDGHAAAFTFDINGTNKSAIDGTLGAATSTAPTSAYAGSPVLSIMSSIGGSASVNVGAIVIFNRALNDSELQSVTSDPWSLAAVANVAPVIDTPEPDLVISTDATVNVDFGATASDANGDTLTVTVSPALPSGLELIDGVMTNTGALSITAADDYTFTYDDGNGGTVDDIVNIEIVAATFRVDSVQETATQFIFTVSNKVGNVSVSTTAGAVTVVSQDATTVTIDKPAIHLFGDKTLNYNTNIVFTLNDGTNTANSTQQIPTPTGGLWAQATSISGYLAKPTGVQGGMHSLVNNIQGDWVIDPATGLNSCSDAGGSFDYYIYDNVSWGGVGTITAAPVSQEDTTAPSITLVGAATITLEQGQAYTEQGATWTDNVDGNGTATVGGDTVDVNTLGTYVVTYSHTDVAGNTGSAQRTVNIIAIQPTANTQNPIDASITIRAGTPYPLSQHVNNPANLALIYTLASGSPALNAGLTLDENTGDLTLSGTDYSTVSGISFEWDLA